MVLGKHFAWAKPDYLLWELDWPTLSGYGELLTKEDAEFVYDKSVRTQIAESPSAKPVKIKL